MGRVTWESLPFPLPGRPNLVLTRDKNYNAKKAEVFSEVLSETMPVQTDKDDHPFVVRIYERRK